MKSVYIKAFLFFMSANICKANAQSAPACDSTPANCSLNLINNLFSNIDTILNISYKASFTLPPESKDVIYAADESVNDCETPPGDPFFDCKNAAASLKYDVYYPKNHRYDLETSGCPLPAFIFFHAGGFKECTNKQLPLATTLCAEMAKRGFVAFSVEYRRGRILDLADDKYTSAQQQLAFYRAAQDVRGAIRSIIKRQQNHATDFPNDPYQIDIDNIFVGGASAGAFAANIGAWYSTSMVADVFPSIGTYTIEDVLGSINADYYYGTPSYNYHNKIKGVLNCWGGIQVPFSFKGNEEDFFSSSIVTPVIAFHGKLDHTVWYDEAGKQKVKFSPSDNPQANSVSDCLDGKSFTLPVLSTPTLISTCSSWNMYNIAKFYSKITELYADCDMGHGIDNTTQTYFGTGLSTNDDVGRYMAQRTAIFFQAVLAGKSAGDIGPPSLFTDCENDRNLCIKNATTGCQNSDDCPSE